ncbi:hypothetical protein BLNAU_21218 [Blattamonas nauphoetae]|uniref:Uncharacterized protein n=1 Tax=Blattamonas nauphoetae TaxID=2049346 RepID=A0ABQ9WZP6_9EUKA|nr:hypothetical protein BLNAU_21218 [Blattamonas nauphoetae]
MTHVEFEPQVVDDTECMGLTIDTAHALQCVMFVHLLHADGSRLVRVPFGDNGVPSTRGSLVFPTRLPTIANNETFQIYSVSMLGWKCPTNIVHATTTLVAEDQVEITLFRHDLEQDFIKEQMILTLELKGRELMSYSGRLSLSDGLKEWKSMRSIEAINSTHCSVSFAVAEKETPTHVGLGRTYTLKATEDDQHAIVVNDWIVIEVPTKTAPLPRAVLSSISTDDSNGSLRVQLFGKNRVCSEYSITFSTVDDQIQTHRRTLTFSSVSATALESRAVPISEEGADSVLPGRRYTVSAAVSLGQNQSIDVSVSPFRTPVASSAPRDPKAAMWIELVPVIVVMTLCLVLFILALRYYRSGAKRVDVDKPEEERQDTSKSEPQLIPVLLETIAHTDTRTIRYHKVKSRQGMSELRTHSITTHTKTMCSRENQSTFLHTFCSRSTVLCSD